MVFASKPIRVSLGPVLAVAFILTHSGWVRAMNPEDVRARAAKAEAEARLASSAGIPEDVQLLNADANPTIRIPVSHSSLNWTLIKPRIKASYGWLEIDRGNLRYQMSRPSRATKEPDQGFAYGRAEISDLKMEYGAAQFRAAGLRHFLGYSPQAHWDAVDSSAASVAQADGVYTPFILQALQSFDSVVANLKARQQRVATPPVVIPPAPQPAPQPVAPPNPPTVVVMSPSGTSDNQTIEVKEPTLTIRGVAMDDAGLPTIAINGAAAALRPKNDKVAEFWSDPINLKPGANRFEIVATSPAKATARFQFVAQFAPPATPVNPRALGKDDIISLLKGGVPDSHVSGLVKDRGIKFTPTTADLDEIRAAGAGDELIQAIKQAAR